MRNAQRDRERQRRYYRENSEKVKESARKWRLANPEKRREIYQRSRLKHLERSREMARKKTRRGWRDGEHERAEACRPGPDYRCPICDEQSPGDWVADHHAASGLFRQWLCRPCNMALGLFRERPERLHSAIGYLAQHPHGCS